MRVLVCGGRDYADGKRVFAELDALMRPAFAAGDAEFVVIHGNAPGADTLADAWAARRNVGREPYGADWKANGRAAGPIRNARMLAEGRPDLVLAFPGGRGTADMVRKANRAGVKVVTVE
jgi:hypothetical protein